MKKYKVLIKKEYILNLTKKELQVFFYILNKAKKGGILRPFRIRNYYIEKKIKISKKGLYNIIKKFLKGGLLTKRIKTYNKLENKRKTYYVFNPKILYFIKYFEPKIEVEKPKPS